MALASTIGFLFGTHKIAIGFVAIDPCSDFTRKGYLSSRWTQSTARIRVWFSSIKPLANVLSEENQTLLQVIREHNPESISELEQLTGRRAGNLARTLHTLESYGIISLKKARIGAGIKIEAARKSGRAPLTPVMMADAIDLKLSF